MGDFHNILKQLRLHHQMTQDDLAKKLGISKSAISMYENGNREPDFETLEAIADFFKVDMNYLLGKGTPTNNPSFYSNDAADAYMNLIHENPELRILLDASAKLTKEDIEDLVKIVKKMRATEQD